VHSTEELVRSVLSVRLCGEGVTHVPTEVDHVRKQGQTMRSNHSHCSRSEHSQNISLLRTRRQCLTILSHELQQRVLASRGANVDLAGEGPPPARDSPLITRPPHPHTITIERGCAIDNAKASQTPGEGPDSGFSFIPLQSMWVGASNAPSMPCEMKGRRTAPQSVRHS
jgi:hypothetical protein